MIREDATDIAVDDDVTRALSYELTHHHYSIIQEELTSFSISNLH